MDRKWIKEVKIEPRGENGGKNITLYVEPPENANYKTPTYSSLVEMAEAVFRDAMKCGAEGFMLTNADVMAWSDRHHHSLYTAHSYRVTADFVPFDKVNANPGNYD